MSKTEVEAAFSDRLDFPHLITQVTEDVETRPISP